MSRDLELAVRADDREAQRALLGIHRAIRKRLAADQWNRTHCTVTLTTTGPGVARNPFTERHPITVRWSEPVAKALHDKRPIGYGEPRRPEAPKSADNDGLSWAQYSALNWALDNAMMEQEDRAFIHGTTGG